MTGNDPGEGRRLRGDRPILSSESDLFGFTPFAKHVADAISRRASNNGLVVGIYGEWGTGKTSVLNLMERELGSGEGGEKLTIIRFNPWWFSSTPEGLLRAFFAQLLAQFPVTTRVLKKARKAIAGFASRLEQVPSNQVAAGAKLTRALLAGGDAAIEKIKHQIDKRIIAERRRFVVIIDDLDRLPHEEIYQVFRLVKAVGDFARFTYVLAFDPRVVREALGRYVPDHGSSYIEKIVQVPFDMPVIGRESLDQAFFKELNRVLHPLEEKDFDSVRWGNLYHGSIRELLKSPRDVSRFIDALSVSYPPHRREVDPIDFVALEALRLHAPNAYRAVATNPDRFGAGGYVAGDPKDAQVWHKSSYLGGMSPELAAVVKVLLQSTFPRMEAVWGSVSYGDDFAPAWRRAKRATSPAHHATYFGWSLPDDCLGAVGLQSLLGGDLGEVRSFLAGYVVGESRQRAKRLRSMLGELDSHFKNEDAAPGSLTLLSGLIQIGDEIDDVEVAVGHDMLEMALPWLVRSLVYRQLGKHPEADRISFIEAHCKNSSGLSTVGCVVESLLREHTGDKNRPAVDEGARLVPRQTIDSCAETIRGRIAALAEDGLLLRQPAASATLYLWCRLCEQECQAWCVEWASNDGRLADLLRVVLTHGSSSGMGDFVARSIPFMSLPTLEALGLQLDQLRARIVPLMDAAEGGALVAVKALKAAFDDPGMS